MALSDRPFGPVSGAASVPNQTPMNVQAAQSGPLPVSQSLTATTETQIMSAENVLVPLSIAIPNSTMLEQTVFDLFASGSIVSTNGTNNVTLKLYKGVSTTIANNTLLGSSGTIAHAVTTASWWAHAQLIYESATGVLSGKIEFYVNKTLVAAVTLSNFPTGVTNSGNPVVNFSLTAQSSGAAAGTPTTVNVQKFTVG